LGFLNRLLALSSLERSNPELISPDRRTFAVKKRHVPNAQGRNRLSDVAQSRKVVIELRDSFSQRVARKSTEGG
jgi:hypothetical protein